MTRFREHRGSLADSLETVVTLETRADLIAHLGRVLAPFKVTDQIVETRHYAFDDRIGWNTYIVVVHGHGPVGFTDGDFL